MTAAPSRNLAAADEANLVLDHAGQVNVFLVAGLLSPGGFVSVDGTADMGALRVAVGSRIAALPPFCRIPVAAGRRHRWAQASPDLDHHIRMTGVVDGQPGLERLCGQLMIVPLPRDRPLWELLIVPGVALDTVGVVLRIHHAMADGVTAVAMMHQLFEPGQDLARPAHVRPAAIRSPRQPSLLSRLAGSLHRIRMMLNGGGEVGRTVLLGGRSPHRGVAFLDTDLVALEARVRPRGATVNDALLAAAASGYRAAIRAAGEEIPAELPVSVPVALHRRGTSANQVGVMIVHLPLTEPRPDERLRLIAARTQSKKIEARGQGTLEFMRGPLGARVLDHLARRQHLVAGFITNVRGPSGAFRLAGARVVTMWPVAVLAGNVRLGVAAVSYDGRLCSGIHFDSESVVGGEFARAMGEELARLASRRGSA